MWQIYNYIYQYPLIILFMFNIHFFYNELSLNKYFSWKYITYGYQNKLLKKQYNNVMLLNVIFLFMNTEFYLNFFQLNYGFNLLSFIIILCLVKFFIKINSIYNYITYILLLLFVVSFIYVHNIFIFYLYIEVFTYIIILLQLNQLFFTNNNNPTLNSLLIFFIFNFYSSILFILFFYLSLYWSLYVNIYVYIFLLVKLSVGPWIIHQINIYKGLNINQLTVYISVFYLLFLSKFISLYLSILQQYNLHLSIILSIYVTVTFLKINHYFLKVNSLKIFLAYSSSLLYINILLILCLCKFY